MAKEIKKTKEEKVIDASGKTLGRVSTSVAVALMGKDSPAYERNKFSGSMVKVINASKIYITPKKLDMIYHTRYSGMPGGLRVTKAVETKEKKGMKELVKLCVKQMLPDNKLKREMLKHLKVED